MASSVVFEADLRSSPAPLTVLQALAPSRRPPIIVAITNLRIMVFTFRISVMRKVAHHELDEGENAGRGGRFRQPLISAARALPS